MRGEIIIGGAWPVSGPVLRLDEPLSFWGGVDPATGRLSDPRSPQHGASIAGTILMVPEPRGSSSSSAVVLELLHRGLAPAALILGAVDAIIGLGILVGLEMALTPIPLLTLPAPAQATFRQGAIVTIDAAGSLMSPTDRPGE